MSEPRRHKNSLIPLSESRDAEIHQTALLIMVVAYCRLPLCWRKKKLQDLKKKTPQNRLKKFEGCIERRFDLSL
jgi:hypothetical protein